LNSIPHPPFEHDAIFSARAVYFSPSKTGTRLNFAKKACLQFTSLGKRQMGWMNNRYIEELVGRASDLERLASLADNPGDRDNYLWLAKRYREKAALLADDTVLSRPPTKELN
jgi:hypothetical protein